MKEAHLLTITQAAERLGINQATLRRWADTGRVPHVKTFGGQRRFEATVIDRLRIEMGFQGQKDSPSKEETP